ncbi:MAG: DMT family protein [Lentisphaerota bacterium]
MNTILLLIASNIFMTLAWYGHLKFFKGQSTPMLIIILISWGIAFLEYCFQVPANRLGYGRFTTTELKIIQEVISISIFIVFAMLVMGERFRWNYGVSFALILAAVYFAFHFK